MKEFNAIIERAEIVIDRGFILSVWLHLELGTGGGQGFGGYSLFLLKSSANHEQSKKANYAGIFISRVMEIAGVDNWDHLKGKTIRIRKEDNFSSIEEIGHIVKDDWFNPKEELKANEKPS